MQNFPLPDPKSDIRANARDWDDEFNQLIRQGYAREEAIEMINWQMLQDIDPVNQSGIDGPRSNISNFRDSLPAGPRALDTAVLQDPRLANLSPSFGGGQQRVATQAPPAGVQHAQAREPEWMRRTADWSQFGNGQINPNQQTGIEAAGATPDAINEGSVAGATAPADAQPKKGVSSSKWAEIESLANIGGGPGADPNAKFTSNLKPPTMDLSLAEGNNNLTNLQNYMVETREQQMAQQERLQGRHKSFDETNNLFDFMRNRTGGGGGILGKLIGLLS